MRVLTGKRITLGVTGSIAAYKAVALASTLHQAGAIVDVAMTPDAQRFIQPLSFQAITHRPVFDNLWAPGMETDIAHVTLGRDSDLILIAPATAHTIACLAHGLASDPVTVTALAARCPIVVAPAMDAGMYTHPATAENVHILRSRGVILVEPESGHLASGLTGLGRLAAHDSLLDAVRATIGKIDGDLLGTTIAVTAGGTREPIDPVRVITNRSSGKMGYALAESARDRGANAVLITTPTALRRPTSMEVVEVERADEMLAAVRDAYSRVDVLIMAAAVGDFRAESASEEKLKRGAEALSLRLAQNLDILVETASLQPRPIRVGFAAETSDLLASAADKLTRKGLDLICANDVSHGVFGEDENAVTLVFADGRQDALPRMSKTEVAERILDAVVSLLRT